VNSFDDEPTKVLYLTYAEGHKRLNELECQLDGALRSQRKVLLMVWICLAFLAALSIGSVCFLLGASSH
jgi:hypothetical protein